MTNETKEIINKLEIVARKHTIEVCEDGSKIETMPASVVDELRLNNYSAKILLDYITNLQEKNERLDKRNKEIYEGFMATTQELCEYAEKIDKAIEYIENKTCELDICFGSEDWHLTTVKKLLEILRGDKHE